MGVPDKRTILAFFADINISYKISESEKETLALLPNLSVAISFSLLSLLTILLIRLCASSITTTASSKIFFSKLSVIFFNLSLRKPL